MTYYFNILFLLHIFGIACYAYLYYDTKLIRNEDFSKWLKDKLGICKKEEYVHSQKYFENLSYKTLFNETFPKFKIISYFIVLDYIIAIILFSFVRINIHGFIDSIFNFSSVSVIIILVISQNIFYLAYIMPEYKTAYQEINYYRSYFEIALRLFVYCSSYLLAVSIVCLLNYYVPDSEEEEKTVKIKDITKVLYVHSGLIRKKYYNVLVVEPSIYGERFISVSDDTLYKAKKGQKIRFTIKKGFFNARFIQKEELLNK